MSRNRSIRNRSNQRHQQKPPAGDLNITSLLDVLTFLLISLLANYNYSGEIVNIPKDITLPKSTSLQMQTSGVSIQISAQKIWVEDQLVLDLNDLNIKSKIVYDEGGRRIIPLFDKLRELKDQVSSLNKQISSANVFSGKANLVVDQKIKYDDLRKILYTCASAGFKEFKFLVLNKEI